MIPLAIVFVAYLAMAKDAPNRPTPKPFSAYLGVLKQADAWWFMLFYGVTFGGFVGLSSSLAIYFTDTLAMTPVAGALVSTPALADDLPFTLRPLIDARLRYEHVDQVPLIKDADAATPRSSGDRRRNAMR